MLRVVFHFILDIRIVSVTKPNPSQLVQNYRQKNVDSLSLIFILNWVLGDSFNFIGSILTKQMMTQILLGFWFIFVDFCMLCQILVYRRKKVDDFVLLEDEEYDQEREPPSRTSSRSLLSHSMTILSLMRCITASQVYPYPTTVSLNSLSIVGNFIAWISASLYFSSRIPQIYKNVNCANHSLEENH